MTLEDIIYYERKEAAEETAKKISKKTLINCIAAYFKKQGGASAELVSKLEEIEDEDKLQSLYELALETKEVSDFLQFL